VSTSSRGLRLDGYCENPLNKILVVFGEPTKGLKEGVFQMWGDSGEPTKGLKEGVFQMWGEGCVCGEEEKN